DASEVTRAVFLVLARRARKLRKKTVLAGWLFHVTSVACRKLYRGRIGRLQRLWRWISRKPAYEVPPDGKLWTRVAPKMDRALERLSSRQRNAVLLCSFLNRDFVAAANVLRTRERRVKKRLRSGMKQLAKRFGTRREPLDVQALASACAMEGCAMAPPDSLVSDILKSIEERRGKRPHLKLARHTLSALAWARWRKRVLIGVPSLSVLVALLGGILLYVDSLSGYSRSLSALVYWTVRLQGMRYFEPPRPWPTNVTTLRPSANGVRSGQELYQTTNIWLAHLSFTREAWKALEPRRIDPMPNFVRPDGMWFLRNPEARRSGVAGVLGFEFDWTHANFEIGGVAFTNAAVRVKGNIRSLFRPNCSFKVDLNKYVRGQKLGGLDELTFDSLVWDYSCLGEALGFELFRDAGVPASRTAYAWLTESVAGLSERKPLGLYLMVEPVDNEFAAGRFGSKQTPVFKPVTYNLFEYLGEDWSAYAPIYDLKTEATPAQKQHVIEFARLVSSGTDAAFAARAGDFLDLDAFARFLAVQVLLSNYDSILADGQNFYMVLDPRSNKLGFIPWDLDAAWGTFWL